MDIAIVIDRILKPMRRNSNLDWFRSRRKRWRRDLSLRRVRLATRFLIFLQKFGSKPINVSNTNSS